jgi:predicted transcriptional regulator
MPKPNIPSAEHVRHALQALTYAQTAELARISGVPFTTLWKVRSGETTDPRLETVRQFFPLLGKVAA